MRGILISSVLLAGLSVSGVAVAGGGGDTLFQCRNGASKAVVGDVYVSGGGDGKEAAQACTDKFPNGCSGGCMGCGKVAGVYICTDRSGGQEVVQE